MNKHTTGAIRAAKEIADTFHLEGPPGWLKETIDNIAATIDRETASPELFAACSEAVRRFDHEDATAVLEWVNDPEFRAAIAKAEGGVA